MLNSEESEKAGERIKNFTVLSNFLDTIKQYYNHDEETCNKAIQSIVAALHPFLQRVNKGTEAPLNIQVACHMLK
jgi:hypothetical protein